MTASQERWLRWADLAGGVWRQAARRMKSVGVIYPIMNIEDAHLRLPLMKAARCTEWSVTDVAGEPLKRGPEPSRAHLIMHGTALHCPR